MRHLILYALSCVWLISPCYGQNIVFIERDQDPIGEFNSEIDIHFNFELTEWDKAGKCWKETLDKSWFTPWFEWSQETSAFKKGNRARQLSILNDAQTQDEKINKLKDSVRVYVRSEESIPYLSYCLAPKGFKVSKYSTWIKLPEKLYPDVRFYPAFFEYLLRDYNKDRDYSRWLHKMKEKDQERYYEEHRKAYYFALKWCKEQDKITRVDWVSLYSDKFRVSEYDENYNTQMEDVNLLITGFTHSPAVAWRCPPRVPDNPMKHMLYKGE